ncbi:MAG TPA: hypothetical protein VF746_26965 [Longimicrobium sp.]|jgi:hypothetical protein
MARVILDIFSGRPNPVWELDDDEAQSLLRELGSARDLVGGPESGSGKLGFRGLLLEGLSGDAVRGLGVAPGLVRVSGDDRRGAELAIRLLGRLGTPHGVAGPEEELPEGLAPLEALDLPGLIRESLEADADSGTATRSTNASTETATVSGDTATTDATGGIQALNPAPVLGTDASSYSTLTQGSCQIEVATFNPNFWNASGVITNNNCYNYASNRRTDTFAQPGRAAGQQATRMRCADVTNGALADGAQQSPNCVAAGQEPRWYTAMVIWPGVDYHWYRKSAEGFWGHKPGQTAAKNTDNSGVVITNPETANRGGYRDFCGYFFMRSGMGIR